MASEGVPVLRVKKPNGDFVLFVKDPDGVLIELKDQDGALGPNVGALERATADALDGYEGDVALMSFNPHAVADLARLAPTRPRYGMRSSTQARFVIPSTRSVTPGDVPFQARRGHPL
jgi:glycerophosphoryl diester phosphodiesterase